MRIVRLKPYLRAMKAMGFRQDDLGTVEAAILAAPEAHPLVRGLKGARKARIARPGMGKRGGGRVIYYFADGKGFLAFLLAYSKNEKDDLTADDRRALLRAIDTIMLG